MDDLQREFLSKAVADLKLLQSKLEIADYSENLHRDTFRLFHTLKGSSQTFNLNVQGKIAHEIENLLQARSDHQIASDENFIALLKAGIEILLNDFRQALADKSTSFPTEYIEKIRTFVPHHSANSSDDLSGLISTNYLRQLSSTEKKALSSALAAGQNFYLLEAGFSFADFAAEFKRLQEVLRQNGEIIATFPSPKFAAENKIGFQIFYVGADDKTQIEQKIQPFNAKLISPQSEQKFSNNLNGILAQAAATGEQIATKFGKKIEFEVISQNIELSPEERQISSETLLHLVRNAADHAIEKTGVIKIEVFKNDDQDLILKISDNGRGIDPEKIRHRAVERNLISANDALSKEEIINLIFAHGFSTSEHVSEISGRGIGLDIVKDSIEKAGGTISVESKIGQGTTFEIYLPQSSETKA